MRGVKGQGCLEDPLKALGVKYKFQILNKFKNIISFFVRY